MANLPPSSLYSQDLRGRRIRLLDLNSVLPGEQEPLQGNLRVISLDRRYWTPTYEALSYVWGEDSDSPSRLLSCSGVKIPITRNCYDALRTLHRNFGVRSIWVDAICINQDNVEEKEHQIPLMRDIYGSARRVFIWLGNGTRESDEAFTWIRRESTFDILITGAMFRPWPANILPSEVLNFVRRLTPLLIGKCRWRIIRYMKFGDYRQYDRDAMKDIVERPWFRRMWTLQELVMASEPHIVCGAKTLSWNELNWGIGKWVDMPGNRSNKACREILRLMASAHIFWITRYQRALHEDNSRTWIQGDGMTVRAWQWLLNGLEARKRLLVIFKGGLMAAIIIVRFLLGLHPLDSKFLVSVLITLLITLIITPTHPAPSPGARPHWEVNLRDSLPKIMNWSRMRDAKQPVDKVFALQGLFQDFGIPLQRPDYSKPIGQVYLEFTGALIQWHECLGILVEAAEPGIPGIPTWVPDWRRRRNWVSMDNAHASGDSVASFTIVSGAYDSSGLSGHNREEFEWIPDVTRNNPSDMPKIITKGFVEDKIAFCFPPLQKVTEQQTFQSEMSEVPAPVLLHNTAVMLHWVAISQNTQFYENESSASKREKFFEIMHCGDWHEFDGRRHLRRTAFPDWLALLNSHINPLSSTETPNPPTVESCARALQANERLYSYHVERCNTFPGRRIFFTTEKKRLGTGPECLKKGGVVALLAGNGNPMALREDKGAYKILGVVGLEGVMKGEAWRDHGEVGELVLV